MTGFSAVDVTGFLCLMTHSCVRIRIDKSEVYRDST